MMSHLIEDCLKIIFNELQYDSPSLYSCILVNKYWCHIAIPILWKNPSSLKGFSPFKLYNIIISLLPKCSKKLLFDNIPELPLSKFSDKPLFNYINYFSQISPDLINNISHTLVNNEKNNFGEKKFKEKYKKYLLEQEIYKLFINNCKDLNFFRWKTSLPLFKYQGATTCFSQLYTLEINLTFVTSENLFDIAQICQNIKHLNVIHCDNTNLMGLIIFIDIQKNLQSLYIDFKYKNNIIYEFESLSDLIERKAFTIKKFVVKSFIGVLSPKILISLTNLQHLELINNYNRDKSEAIKDDWDKYLSIASFPNLQYLKITNLPFFNDYMLIEKSYENILEINIFRGQIHNPIYTKKLIIVISKYCLRIKKLTINIEPENLKDLKEIFLNCKQLEKIGISLNSDEYNGDKLLEIISDYSPETLCECLFYKSKNSIFTIKGLENFFENWKKRNPLILNIINLNLINEVNFTDEYNKIIKKYIDEGIIKEYKYY